MGRAGRSKKSHAHAGTGKPSACFSLVCELHTNQLASSSKCGLQSTTQEFIASGFYPLLSCAAPDEAWHDDSSLLIEGEQESHADPRLCPLRVESYSYDPAAGAAVLLGDAVLASGILRLFRRGPCALPHPSCVCVLAVPAWLSVTKFLDMIPEDRVAVQQLRALHDHLSSRYVLLVQFTNEIAALSFFTRFNGRPFSGADGCTICCKVVPLHSLEFKSIQVGPLVCDISAKVDDSCASQTEIRSLVDVELPTCPICLDRLDENASGVLTTVCQHKFHCDCYEGWLGSELASGRCPVCRYSAGHPSTCAQTVCAECGTDSNLWACIICGHIGCGRYASGHASTHFQSTKHRYSFEINTERVWDYVSDSYVHRLLDPTNEDLDDMLIDVGSNIRQQPTRYCDASIQSSDALADRAFVEMKNRLEEITRRLRAVEKERDEAKRLVQQQKKLTEDASTDAETERFLVQELCITNTRLREQLEEKSTELESQKELLHDLTMHLTAGSAIAGNPKLKQDLANATLIVRPRQQKGRKR